MHSRILIGVVLCAAGGSSMADDTTEWKYLVDDSDTRLPFRSLSLREELPGDVRIEVETQANPLITQLRYGDANSTRIAIVVDAVSRDEFVLYVDRNRNRVIEQRDRIAGTGRSRTLTLDAEVISGDFVDRFPRDVLIRRGLGRSLRVATLGCFEGQATLLGEQVAVRRFDRDANGFFADLNDEIQIDLNHDGRWDAFTERFPFTPLLKLDGKRIAVRGDPLGKRLELNQITATGIVRLDPESLRDGAGIAEMNVTLNSEDGSAFAVRSLEPISVPAGRYTFGTVHMTVRDSVDQPWTFVFSRRSAPTKNDWFIVFRDQETRVDPIGKLRFTIDCEGPARRGKLLRIQPQLFTESGLLINSGCPGEEASRDTYSNPAGIDVFADGVAVDRHRSGFT